MKLLDLMAIEYVVKRLHDRTSGAMGGWTSEDCKSVYRFYCEFHSRDPYNLTEKDIDNMVNQILGTKSKMDKT
jgi:hypothetical protein